MSCYEFAGRKRPGQAGDGEQRIIERWLTEVVAEVAHVEDAPDVTFPPG